MAEPSPSQPLTSMQRKIVPSGQALNEEKNSEGDVGENLNFMLQLEPVLEQTAVDSDVLMSAEELEEDDLLDDGGEYEKEVALQRSEDVRNGHFSELEPLSRFWPAMEDDDGRLHSLSEIQDMRDTICQRSREATHHVPSHIHQFDQPKSAASPLHILPLLPKSDSPAKVLQRVADLEAILHPSDGDKMHLHPARVEDPEPATSAATTPFIPHQPIKIKKKEKKMHGKGKAGKDGVLHSSNDGKSNLILQDACAHVPIILEDAVKVLPPTCHTASASPTVTPFQLNDDQDMGDQSPLTINQHPTNTDLLPAEAKERAILAQPPINQPHKLDHPTDPAPSLGSAVLGQVSLHPSSPFVLPFPPTTAQSTIINQPNSYQPNSSHHTNSAQPNTLMNAKKTVSFKGSTASSSLTGNNPHPPHALPLSSPHSHPSITHHSPINPSHPPKNRSKKIPPKPGSKQEAVAVAAALFSGVCTPAEAILTKIPSQNCSMLDEEMIDFPPPSNPWQRQMGIITPMSTGSKLDKLLSLAAQFWRQFARHPHLQPLTFFTTLGQA